MTQVYLSFVVPAFNEEKFKIPRITNSARDEIIHTDHIVAGLDQTVA